VKKKVKKATQSEIVTSKEIKDFLFEISDTW